MPLKRVLEVDAMSLSPKISLHDHLDGSLRLESIIELANAGEIALPESEVKSLRRWISDVCGSGTLANYLKSFAVTSSVMQTEAALTRIAREYVIDAAMDGVIYAETRWAPLVHLRNNLTPKRAVEAVHRGLAEGMEIAGENGHAIHVNQILTALRHEANSIEVATLALDSFDLGVVGFDLAGPESGFPPSLHKSALDLLERRGMAVTIHAGEAAGPESVLAAIQDGHARRIGHGVRIAEDIQQLNGEPKLGPMATLVRDSGATLELAPRSNLQTESSLVFGPKLSDHPFDLLYKSGFPVTVNPDNRLMSESTVTLELTDLKDTFSYGWSDFRQFQIYALQGSFCDASMKQKLQTVIENFAWESLLRL